MKKSDRDHEHVMTTAFRMVLLTACKGDRKPNAEKRVQVEIVVETSSNAKVEVHHRDKESDDEKVDETTQCMSAT